MLAALKTLLARAERSIGWNKNSKTPWVPLIELIESELELAGSDVHATKIQKRSATKSLWQGRLHRDPPIQSLLLAVDDPCDDKSFEAVSSSVEHRFRSPSTWADMCLVLSDRRLIGCVEREGIGIADWLAESLDVESAFCDSRHTQLDLRDRIDAKLSPQNFVVGLQAALRSNKKDAVRKYAASVFKVSPDEVLFSLTSSPSNAAKGRWEGGDMDPDVRYRVGIVGADNWAWDRAAIEVMHRMQPPDLTLGFALLCAKSRAGGAWDRFRAFVSDGAERAVEIGATLRRNGIHDIHFVAVQDAGPIEREYVNKTTAGSKLRVRDTDAGEIRYEVSKPKSRVHDFLTNLLRKWADQEALDIREGIDSISMYDALVRLQDEQYFLVEVKSSAGPGVVRLAVGQLIDYRRVLLRDDHVRHCECVLLLPSNEELTEEMRALLAELKFSWAMLREIRRGAKSKLVLELHRANGSVYSIPSPN